MQIDYLILPLNKTRWGQILFWSDITYSMYMFVCLEFWTPSLNDCFFFLLGFSTPTLATFCQNRVGHNSADPSFKPLHFSFTTAPELLLTCFSERLIGWLLKGITYFCLTKIFNQVCKQAFAAHITLYCVSRSSPFWISFDNVLIQLIHLHIVHFRFEHQHIDICVFLQKGENKPFSFIMGAFLVASFSAQSNMMANVTQ